jgi:hypothetical protein
LPAQAFSVIQKKHLTRRANQGHICIIPPFASRPRPCAAAVALLVLDAEQAGSCSGLPPTRIAEL